MGICILITNIAFVINKNYIGQFKVTFYSLVKTNGELSFFVRLLHGDLDEYDKHDVEKFVHSFNAEIEFYKIDDGIFSGLPKMEYDNSYTAYYKTLLPYLLSMMKDKVLFLDCDVIVRGKIERLYSEDNGHFLSCVEDYKISRCRKEHKRLIIGEPDIKYFNSGVMLFNFSNIDKIVPKEILLEYILNNKDKIVWHDQDILNHFYAKECYFLDEKYNYLTTYKSIFDILFQKGKNKAVIVHYANWKPWNSNYIGKYYRLYKKHYDALTGEKGVDYLKKRKLSAQLKLVLYYLFRKTTE